MRFQQNRSILEKRPPFSPSSAELVFGPLCGAGKGEYSLCSPCFGGDKKLKPPRRAGGKHLDWHTRVLPGIAIVQTIRIPG